MEERKSNITPVSFNKISLDAIPAPGLGVPRVLSETTKQTLEELRAMQIGDVLHIPITEQVEEVYRKATVVKYEYSCRTAANRLDGEYKVMRRGTDVYIHRLG